MSRRRYVSTEISTDKAVNRLAMHHSDFAALLYTWLIPHAEDDATFDADPEEVLMKVCPGRRDKEAVDIQNALDAMLDLGLIERCADARRYRFPQESFYRYQSYIKEERRGSANRAPKAAPQPPTAHNSEDQRNSAPNTASFSFSDSDSDSDSQSMSGADAPTHTQVRTPAPVRPDPTRELFEYYKANIQPKAYSFTPNKLRARIREFGMEACKRAVDNFAADWWEMQQNAHRGADWFFRSRAKTEEYINMTPRAKEQHEQGRSNGRPEPAPRKVKTL